MDFWCVFFFPISQFVCKKREISGCARGKQPTYLEPGCRYGALGVAVIQRDDGDDILRVGLQVGQSVKLTVSSELHCLHTSPFQHKKSQNDVCVQIREKNKTKHTAVGRYWLHPDLETDPRPAGRPSPHRLASTAQARCPRTPSPLITAALPPGALNVNRQTDTC